VPHAYAAPAAALPIVADLIDLPKVRPTTRLLDVLPPATAALLTPDNVLRTNPPPLRAGPPVALGERKEYLALARRLHELGMARAIPQAHVRQSVGVFCVGKAGKRLRLITDARRTNNDHAPPPHVRLPNPGNLASLEADRFVAGCQDLVSFYFMLLLPDWLVGFFTLPRLRPEEALSLGLPPDHQLAMAVLPMGWSWAVFLAEAVHLHILATVRPASTLLGLLHAGGPAASAHCTGVAGVH
jgi:hypothetical protein